MALPGLRHTRESPAPSSTAAQSVGRRRHGKPHLALCGVSRSHASPEILGDMPVNEGNRAKSLPAGPGVQTALSRAVWTPTSPPKKSPIRELLKTWEGAADSSRVQVSSVPVPHTSGSPLRLQISHAQRLGKELAERPCGRPAGRDVERLRLPLAVKGDGLRKHSLQAVR